MITNYIIMRDYETGSRNPKTTQVTQLAAIAIDPRSLEIVPDSFYSVMVKPEWDEEKCKKMGVDPIEQGALNKCGFTKEESFKDAIEPKVAWKDYCSYLKKFNMKGETGSVWDAPHVAGYNSTNFDDVIDEAMCAKYGPKPGDRGITIYHPITKIDVLPLTNLMFNNVRINPANSFSMDAIREYMGMSDEYSHRADFDVFQCAYLLIKYMRLFRALTDGNIDLPQGKKIKFHNCFTEENKLIKKML